MTQTRTTHAAAPVQPHFEVHRSTLRETGAALGLAALWTLFWFVFVLALASPSPARSAPLDGREPAPALLDVRAAAARLLGPAQPDQGPSSRGVASPEPVGAG